jgi:hypothetical protein
MTVGAAMTDRRRRADPPTASDTLEVSLGYGEARRGGASSIHGSPGTPQNNFAQARIEGGLPQSPTE